MTSLPPGVVETPASETRILRSRPKSSTPDQGHKTIDTTPNSELDHTEALESEQPAKRLKLSQETSMDAKNAIPVPNDTLAQVPAEGTSSLLDGSTTLSTKELSEGKRRAWTLPRTKRASSLNLHNHPVISHPVGIAIWLLQKIDQARKSNSSDDERSPSASVPTSPGGVRTSTEMGVSGARIERSDSGTTFSFKPSSLTGAQPLWGQSNVNEHEDDTARRQAQRHRKTKQRSENWAKNKENDVVARAKLEAKKKYGTHAQQEMERKRFVDERVRDDYGRLLGRQTAQFADALAQLAPFRVGHSDDFVTSSLPRFDYHHPYVQAGKLLLDVLPALAEPQVSDRSQKAADALLSALEHGNPDEGSFFSFIEALSDDETIQRGIDKVLGQLLNARPEERRGSRTQASPGGGHSAPSTLRTSPDSTGSGLKTLTWQEPATLEGNNLATPNNFVPPTETQNEEQPGLPALASNCPQDLTPPSTQAGFKPSSSSSAYSTPSTVMFPPPSPPPPPPASPAPPTQARSSGRERKPTTKVLAASTETPSRPPIEPPSVASRPNLTRNSKSAPRVPSKLGLSELVPDPEESFAKTTTSAASTHPQTLPQDTSSTTTTTADQRTFPPTSSGQLVPPVIPWSLQHHQNVSPHVDPQPVLDPQLTANLLQLAEIAANMSDSEDDEPEMESNDLPHHERLIRALEAQANATKRHINTPIPAEKAGNPATKAPLPSVPHVQTTSVNPAPAPPASLPPVNTIMSAKEAQAASSFFKSLVTGKPSTNVQRSGPPSSNVTKSDSGAGKIVTPAQDLRASDTIANGEMSSIRSNAAGNGALPPQLSGPETQKLHFGNKTLSGKTQWGELSTNGQRTVSPPLTRPEVQSAITRHCPMSPQKRSLPLERKRKLEERKIEDEGYDIAMSRLRSYAKSLGLPVDQTMSYEQLNMMIDNHDPVARSAHSRANGPSTRPPSAKPHSSGPPTNGIANNGWISPIPNMERPSSSEGLRRLAPNSASPIYNNLHSRYSLPPPGSLAVQYIPPSHSFSYSDAQRSLKGHVNHAHGRSFQFLPPKQPDQFSNPSSSVVDKSLPTTNGDDARQQRQDALNGGPPGGGAVINGRANKSQQPSKAANYKFRVNAKDPPIAQSQPKRGGQLMTFG